MSKRLFIAIPICPKALLLSKRAFLMSNLQEERINWVKEENFHLTLKFIGKTASKQIPEIIKTLYQCALKIEAFPMQLNRIGIFGSHYHARVVWAGISENTQLNKLQKCLVQDLEKIGFPSDRQNFVPHFTLGRIKDIKHKDHFKNVMDKLEKDFIEEAKVNEFVLYESILTSEGPIYKVIQHFELNG